jgi:hypothetical protein
MMAECQADSIVMCTLALRLICALSLLAFPAAGHTLAQTQIQLNIEKLTPTATGFDVLIGVKNLSKRPVVMDLALVPGELQWLDVQQWDDKLGWQTVGPCRDAVPDVTTTLKPNEETRYVVPIGDTSHGWNNTVCPRKIAHLGGKVRAILYFTSESVEKSRSRDRKGRVDIVSAPVQLPSPK